MTLMELKILGCGSATPSLRHMPSCQVLNAHNTQLMIDCGEGAQLKMKQMRLKTSRLNNIFISHLHGDHCFGLVGFISTLALHGKSSTLTIHTFPEGIELFRRWTDYFCRDLPFTLEYNAISPTKHVIFENNNFTVSTFPLLHRVPATGFLIAEKPKKRKINREAVTRHNVPHFAMNDLREGRDFVTPDGLTIPNSELTFAPDPQVRYAYCSDTKPSKRVVSAVEGVDWLYHEATYDDTLRKMAVKRYHSTAGDAARVARDAGVGQLILGHFSARYTDESLLLTQAREIFPRTCLANEGATFALAPATGAGSPTSKK